MKKIITVRFEGEGPENCYDLKQWDRGVTLRIEGLSLPEKVEVHFALDNSDMAQVYLGTTEDGVTTVKVPAFILENADGIACVSGGKYKAFAYIYQSDEESGWTVRKIIFHIEARQRPEDYIHTEEDLKTWEKLEKRIGEVQQEIPKKVSELDNDEGYLTEETDPTVPGWAKEKAPDKSLKMEGKAADSKAVGDRFVGVEKNITDYLNGEVNKINETIEAQKVFVAEYGTTGYEEILNAFKSNKQLLLHIPARKTSETQPEMYAPLVRVDNGGVDIHNFVFVCEENCAEHHFVMSHGSKSWTAYDTILATNDYVKIIDNNLIEITEKEMSDARDISSIKQTLSGNSKKISDHETRISRNNSLIDSAFSQINIIGKYISNKEPLLSALSGMDTVGILKSAYSFRVRLCENAGTMHIKNQGIYLIMQGGTGNKQIIINQNGTEVLNKKYNGILVMAYENSYITPIGIETSLSIAGTIKMPGTFQGWSNEGNYSTTINYPENCIVAYLGNNNVYFLE